MTILIKRATLLALFLAPGCAAQFLYSNALTTVGNTFGSVSSRASVIAPAMLATVRNQLVNPFFSVISLAGAIESLPIAPPPIPATAKVFIRPAGATAVLSANIVSAAAGTVTFVVPAGVPFGTAEVAWQINTDPWQSLNVTVAPTNFELARIGLAGPALAQNLNADNSLNPNGLTTPARPGQTVWLSGSGLGYGTPVTATLAGLPATVLYAGRGTPAGHDQIQLQVPSGVPDSCYAPLTLSWGTSSTTTSSLSVTADGSPCQHPLQLSLTDMKSLDAGGTLPAAQISINSGLQAALSTSAWHQENAYLSESSMASADLYRFLLPARTSDGCTLVSAQQIVGVVANVASFAGIPTPPPLPDLGNTLTLQNAATTLTLSNSNGQSSSYNTTLPTPLEGPLPTPPAPVLAPGKWTWHSFGSTDLAASAVDFTMPTPLQINAGAPLFTRRDQDQTITWNGTAFDPAAILTGSLSSPSQTILCTATARTGTLTIPQALLAGFPAASLGTLYMGVQPAGAALPHALLKTKAGNTLLLLVNYYTTESRPVDFQ